MASATSMEEGDAPRRRIRVAFCLDSFDPGGTELNAVRTIEQIDRTRFDVSFIVLSDRGPLAQRVRDAGVPIHAFSLGGFFTLQGLRAGRALVAHLRKERIDILHAHDIYSNIFAVPCGRIAGVPLVIASRRWWHAANRRVYLALNRATYRLAHRVLANAESVGHLVVSEGVREDHVVVIPNFVEDHAFERPGEATLASWRTELGVHPDDEVVGIVANLHAIKDHATLLRAFPAVLAARPRARLVVVGDGVEREPLERLATTLGIRERVIFAGRRPQRPTMHWLFDVSVLCSLGEGFPNSVVEAMAAARPLVVTAVGGVPDVVVEGETGFQVAPSSPDQLARRIVELLRAPSLRARLGEAGAQRARAEYHAPRVIQRLESLYESYLTEHPHR